MRSATRRAFVATLAGGITYPPKNPAKFMTGCARGVGRKVLCHTNNSAPAPLAPFEQNLALQTVQKKLNADVSFTIVSAG